MHKINLRILQDFRDIRFDVPEKSLPDLIAKIKGNFTPLPVMTIDDTIREYLRSGKTADAAFKLTLTEVEQLKEFAEGIKHWQPAGKFTLPLSPDITLTGELDKLYGKEGAEVLVGYSEFTGILDYDDLLTWKAYCEAFGLQKFNLFHIGYGDWRPYVFEFANYSFYPEPLINNFLLTECEMLIRWAEQNNLLKFFK